MKTDLEKAFECLERIYHSYAVLKPTDDFLQEIEFIKLVKEQLQPFLKRTLPPNLTQDAYIKQLFKKCDKNHDGKLNFTEFVVVFGMALNDCHNRSHELGEDGQGQGQGHCHSHDDGSVHCH